MTDQYAWWRRALAGEAVEVHENEPQAGFYAFRQKSGDRIAVAIWTGKSGALVAKRSDGQACDPSKAWTWVAGNPIPEAYYRAVVNGEPWPDAPPPPRQLSNLPDDPAEAIQVELEGEAENLETWLVEGITTDERAVAAASWAKRIAELKRRADDQRKAEKKPHDDAGKAVQAKWNPKLDLAEKLVEKLTSAIYAYKRERDRLLALAAAKQAEAGEVVTALPTTSSVGRKGEKVTFRKTKTAVVEDWEKLMVSLHGDPDMRALAQTLANRAAVANVALAGCKIEVRESVAA